VSTSGDGGGICSLQFMPMSELMRMSEPVRRLELFTGQGRRRAWSDEDKAAILAESEAPGHTISGTARRHGLTPQQLFAWRRLARRGVCSIEDPAPLFVPALVTGRLPGPSVATPPRPRRRRSSVDGIELEVAGVAVRIGVGASAAQITAVIRALKATT
jgi:transposase